MRPLTILRADAGAAQGTPLLPLQRPPQSSREQPLVWLPACSLSRPLHQVLLPLLLHPSCKQTAAGCCWGCCSWRRKHALHPACKQQNHEPLTALPSHESSESVQAQAQAEARCQQRHRKCHAGDTYAHAQRPHSLT